MIAKHPVQRVEVSFAGPPPVRQIERASGVSDVDTDGTIVRCLVTGDLATTDYSIYTVFYGFDFIVVAYLVFNSMFLPRVIGVLLAIDAATYLASGFATMIAPGVAAHLGAWVGLPTIIAEGSLCLWLLVAGVNVERWKEQASAAFRLRCAQVQELA